MRYLPIILIALLCGSGNTALADSDEEQQTSVRSQDISALVQTVPIRQMQLSSRVTGYGTVSGEPDTQISLNLPIAGQVDALYVTPGQPVTKGTLLLETSPDPTGSLAYAQAENALRFAKSDLQHTRSLYEQKLATRSQLAAAEKALADARQALAAQQALGNDTRRRRLTAPFDGVVISVAVASGDRFAAGANLLQLARSGSQRVLLDIEPEASRALHAGQRVTVSPVFDAGQQEQGSVAQVGRQIDPHSRMVKVTVHLNGNGQLLNGADVRGDIVVASHTAPAVPRQAVLSDDRGNYIFQVTGGHARRVDVKTGIEDNGWVEVEGALPAAPVVTLGNYELTDGMAVREQP